MERGFHIGKMHINTVYVGPERPQQPTIIYYTVRFVIDRSKCSFSGDLEQSIEQGCSAVEPTFIVNSGWRFVGWDKSFTNVRSDLVVTAQFEEIPQEVKATITWDENGGNSGLIPQQIPVGIKIGNLPLTSRTGYEFSRWVDSNGNVVTGDTIVQSDMTVIAQWTPIEYTITYDIDSGWTNPNTRNKFTIEDEFIPLPAERTGYSFMRWEPESISIGTTSNITFTGYGQINRYTITFDNCIDSPTQTQYEYGTIINIPNQIPHNGYTFDGWYTEKNGGTKIETNTIIVTQDEVFYAHWTEIQYDISYNMNGHGVEPTGLKKTYTITDSYVPSAPQNPNGYVFKGWEPNSISVGSTGDKEFNAIWNLEEYTIEYELNGHGELSENAPRTYTIESMDVVPPSLIEDGWTFKGWTPASIPHGSTGNVKFVASWEEIEIPVEDDPVTLRNTMDLDVVLTGQDGIDITLPGKMNETQMGQESETIVKKQQYTIKDCTFSGIEDDTGTIYHTGSSIEIDSDLTFNKHEVQTTQEELDQISAKYPITVEIPDDEHIWNPEINDDEEEQVTQFDGTKLKICVTDEYRTFTFNYLDIQDEDNPATIYWGDGSTERITSLHSWADTYSHTYESNGEYIITIDNKLLDIGISETYKQEKHMLQEVISLGSNIQTLTDHCFYGCEKLEEITIPGKVQYIEQSAFAGCTNLKTITCLSKTAPTIFDIDSFDDRINGKCGQNVIGDKILRIPEGSSGYVEDSSSWKRFLIDYCGYQVEQSIPVVVDGSEEAYLEEAYSSRLQSDIDWDSLNEFVEDLPEDWEPVRGLID